jgi:hypothetical protein
MPEFTTDWFERDAEEKFQKYLSNELCDDYLEIGVCEGASTIWVLDNLRAKRAVGVDWWTDGKGNQRRQKVFSGYRRQAHKNLNPYSNCELYHTTSRKYMGACEDQFDLIYIDGDHSGSGCMRDLIMAYELLKVNTHKRELATGVEQKAGGILVVDDLQRSTSRNGQYECRLAVDLFAALMMGRMYKLWEDGRQCAFVRIG